MDFGGGFDAFACFLGGTDGSRVLQESLRDDCRSGFEELANIIYLFCSIIQMHHAPRWAAHNDRLLTELYKCLNHICTNAQTKHKLCPVIQMVAPGSWSLQGWFQGFSRCFNLFQGNLGGFNRVPWCFKRIPWVS